MCYRCSKDQLIYCNWSDFRFGLVPWGLHSLPNAEDSRWTLSVLEEVLTTQRLCWIARQQHPKSLTEKLSKTSCVTVSQMVDPPTLRLIQFQVFHF